MSKARQSIKEDNSSKELLNNVISDEKKSIGYLLSKIDNIRCPSCSYSKYYILSRKRIRCVKCKKDYNPLIGSKFSRINLPYSTWLKLIKLFELSTTARLASLKIGVSYKTTLNVFCIIRGSILEEISKKDYLLKRIMKCNSIYFDDLSKKKKTVKRNSIIIVGIKETKDRVTVDILKNMGINILLENRLKRLRGNNVYTDSLMGYDSLVFIVRDHLRSEYQKIFTTGNMYIDDSKGFWPFFKERLINYRGSCPTQFLYYLKETEWRYNNRNNNIFDLLVRFMLVAN